MRNRPDISDPLAELESFLDSTIPFAPSSPPIAVFDCDGTIIAGDIGEAMLYHQLEHFLFRVSPAGVWEDYPHRNELQQMYHDLLSASPKDRNSHASFIPFAEMILSRYFDQLAEMKTAKACSDIVRLCAGFSVGEIRGIAKNTLEYELSSPVSQRTMGRFSLPRGIRYIAQTEHALDLVRQRGFDVWVVSGSNTWAVEAVFLRYGIPPERIIGISLTERNGVLAPEVDGAIPVLEGKIEALERVTDRPPVVVFSDSVYDVPLFKFSSAKRVLINSRNGTSTEFFAAGGMNRDHSWIVIESPTLKEENG